ncbi:tetratricopeptide repeat protein [Marinobacterium arenosum]|uniref:tetratricopeptide repeat protein n=1 Tax=Marinobacterium arenosum TaxID=2862496 RepID=UPI001C95930B|nr:tetratricopeptide repeat protein [Marinobacterium arenosum]MBY4678300.1 hypothetical protein [Marinobacterium arenosum]
MMQRVRSVQSIRLPMAALAVTLLAGCAGQGYRVPVEDRSAPAGGEVQIESRRESSGVTVTPVAPPVLQTRPLESAPLNSSVPDQAPQAAPLPVLPPQSRQPRNAAVVALLNNARQQAAQGELLAAQSSLERAQRIAPRDPEVYYQLAELRRRQQQYRQAEQLALRGLELSGGQPAMQRALWLLVADVRQADGDRQGAREARERAARY